MIVDYIDTHREQFAVDPICRVLTEHEVQIAPSSYLRRQTARPRLGSSSERGLRGEHRARPPHDQPGPLRGPQDVACDETRWSRRRPRSGWPPGAISGAAGVVRGKHRTITAQRDDRAPRHPDLIDRHWGAPTRPISGGAPTSPTTGRWRGSSTQHSSSMCSPAGSSGGGS